MKTGKDILRRTLLAGLALACLLGAVGCSNYIDPNTGEIYKADKPRNPDDMLYSEYKKQKEEEAERTPAPDESYEATEEQIAVGLENLEYYSEISEGVGNGDFELVYLACTYINGANCLMFGVSLPDQAGNFAAYVATPIGDTSHTAYIAHELNAGTKWEKYSGGPVL